MQPGHSLKDKVRAALRLDRAVRFVWQTAPGWTLAGAALLLLQGLLPLATLYLTKLIVDTVAAAIDSTAPDQMFISVAWLIVLAAIATLLTAAAQNAGALISQHQGRVVSDRMQTVLHAHSVRADLAYYENPAYFDTLHLAQQQGAFRPQRIVDGLMRVGQNTVALIAMAGLLFSFSPLVPLVLLGATLPGVLARLRHAQILHRWQRDSSRRDRQSQYLGYMLTGVDHAKEIRLFGLGKFFADQFGKLRDQLRDERWAIGRRRLAADLVAETIAIAAVFFAYGLIALDAVAGRITIGDMVMFFAAFQRGLGALKALLGAMADLYEDNLYLLSLYQFLDLPPKLVDPEKPLPVPKKLRKGIAFENVGFTYPGTRKAVLEDIHLHVAPGEVIALAGANGAGKSSLVKLLCRLYDPDQGTVSLDGIDLRRFSLNELRATIRVIFQDFVRYHMPARENIRYGNIALAADAPNIETAARQAGVHELICNLPQGYDTPLGRWVEDGRELSVGEWQKVALARAFAGDAAILVLDEPTSSMDADSEYELFARMRKLMAGRSVLLISHRFSSIRLADRIYVLDKGRIAEQGTHRQLMESRGIYARMYEHQAGAYQADAGTHA